MKMDTDTNTPKGDGDRALMSLLKPYLFFYNIEEMRFGPSILDPKAYNLLKK